MEEEARHRERWEFEQPENQHKRMMQGVREARSVRPPCLGPHPGPPPPRSRCRILADREDTFAAVRRAVTNGSSQLVPLRSAWDLVASDGVVGEGALRSSETIRMGQRNTQDLVETQQRMELARLNANQVCRARQAVLMAQRSCVLQDQVMQAEAARAEQVAAAHKGMDLRDMVSSRRYFRMASKGWL